MMKKQILISTFLGALLVTLFAGFTEYMPGHDE